MNCSHRGCLAGIHFVPEAIARKICRPGWRWKDDGKLPPVAETLCPAHAPIEVRP